MTDKAFDIELIQQLREKFDVSPYRYINDYNFDLLNNQTLSLQLSMMAYHRPGLLAGLKTFLDDYPGKQSDQFLLTRAYCHYVDQEFCDGLELIFELVERNHASIDEWIDLMFFLPHLSDMYPVYINMRFHLMYFIHFFHKYDFMSVNRDSLNILSDIVRACSRNPEVRNGYTESVEFDTQYLILTGECNNNCIGCPIPERMKDFDVSQRTAGTDTMPLMKYIYYKIRKKSLKHLVIKGGEPTLHRSLPKILKTVQTLRNDLRVLMRTNGRRYSNRDFLRATSHLPYPNLLFEVSLFSCDNSLHDSISRCEGSLSQTLSGIKNLLDAGQETTAAIPVLSQNIDVLEDSVSFLAGEFSGLDNFNGVNLYLPFPGAGNLGRYSKNDIRDIHNHCIEVAAAFNNSNIRIDIPNSILAET